MSHLGDRCAAAAWAAQAWLRRLSVGAAPMDTSSRPGGGGPQSLVAPGAIGPSGDGGEDERRGAGRGRAHPRDPYHGRTEPSRSASRPRVAQPDGRRRGGPRQDDAARVVLQVVQGRRGGVRAVERKETAPEIETRRQLAEAQTGARRRARAAGGHRGGRVQGRARQEGSRAGRGDGGLAERLKELSLADERRLELRTLREATRSAPRDERAADQAAFMPRQAAARGGLLQSECDACRRSSTDAARRRGGRGCRRAPPPPATARRAAATARRRRARDEGDDDLNGDGPRKPDRRRQRREKRALSSATVCVRPSTRSTSPWRTSSRHARRHAGLRRVPAHGGLVRRDHAPSTTSSSGSCARRRLVAARAERLGWATRSSTAASTSSRPTGSSTSTSPSCGLHRYVNIVPIIAKSTR